MPHLSYNQPSFYSDQGEIRQEITALAAAGKLSGPQMHYAGPTRPLEELYNTAEDPRQVRNLASSESHRSVLEDMRRRLRDWMVSSRDLGLLPEGDMARRSAGSTPYEMAGEAEMAKSGEKDRKDDSKRYPQQRILAAAELVGRGPGVRDRQVALFEDADAAVRYWAAVGLGALGTDAAPAAPALARALDDPAPAVRIEAAAALCAMGRTREALPVIGRELGRSDLAARLRAARAAQLLGERARPLLPAMKDAYRQARAGKGDAHMFIRFALEPALSRLQRE
jgi:hypothetical protein